MRANESLIRLRNLLISLATVVALVLYAASYSEPVLRASFMPDESPSLLRRKSKPLLDYLEQRVGMKIEFRPVPDGDTLVEALLANKLDIVWMDGFSFIRAQARSGGQVVPLVERAEDAHSSSVFVTMQAGIGNLEDLRGKTVACGAKLSASAHLVPRAALLGAYLQPDVDVKIIFSGSPEATVAAMLSGNADAGALSGAAWEKLIAQGKVDPKVMRVFHRTADYHDYHWAVRADMDFNLRLKLGDAFLALDKHNGRDKEILDFQDASRFVATNAENYAAIEAAAGRAGIVP